MTKFAICLILLPFYASGLELALTFDDAPGENTFSSTAEKRSERLLQTLKELKIPPVIIFANPCNGEGVLKNLEQLKKFQEAGHLIGNHTCTHPNLNKVGFDRFTKDILEAEVALRDLMPKEKLFRFPFFQEGYDVQLRDRVRVWLKEHGYRNIPSSLENEDPIFSAQMNKALKLGKKVDYEKLKTLFVNHTVDGIQFYDKLAVRLLGRSPKHNILLHDKDATVRFLPDLVREIRKRGWKIISVKDAIADPLFSVEPKSTYSTNGLLGQIAFDGEGKFEAYYDFKKLSRQVDVLVGLK